MNESTVDKALARLLDVQTRLERALSAAGQTQSRITAAGESLERTGRAIVQVTAKLDRLHRLRQP